MIYEITREELQTIGERIKQVQRMANRSDFDIASLLGISEIQYSKLLRGISMVTEDKFLVLHKEFGVSLDFLFTGYERDGKLLPDKEHKTTEMEFNIFANAISCYIKELPLNEKKEKMKELVLKFIKLIDSL